MILPYPQIKRKLHVSLVVPMCARKHGASSDGTLPLAPGMLSVEDRRRSCAAPSTLSLPTSHCLKSTLNGLCGWLGIHVQEWYPTVRFCRASGCTAVFGADDGSESSPTLCGINHWTGGIAPQAANSEFVELIIVWTLRKLYEDAFTHFCLLVKGRVSRRI